jgi:hypothetical protein
MSLPSNKNHTLDYRHRRRHYDKLEIQSLCMCVMQIFSKCTEFVVFENMATCCHEIAGIFFSQLLYIHSFSSSLLEMYGKYRGKCVYVPSKMRELSNQRFELLFIFRL